MSPPILLLFSFIYPIYGNDIVPVLLWGNFEFPHTKIPSLNILKTYQFTGLIDELVTNRPNILLFMENKLSIEDIGLKDQTSQSVFSRLKNLKSKEFLFLPAVEAPLHSLHHLTHLGYKNAPNILKINLREPFDEESRFDLLRDHDRQIAEIAGEKLSEENRTLLIFTGRHNKKGFRQKREVGDEKVQENKIVMSDGENTILIVTSPPIIYQVDGNDTFLGKVMYTSTESNRPGRVILDVRFDKQSLDFVFNAVKGQPWQLDYIKAEEANVKMTTNLKLGAPCSHSFYCGKNITFTGTSESGIVHVVTFQTLQLQPYVNDKSFSPAIDCVPYFSSPIWSGIMVVALLLFVFAISLLCILDIHTMDKFDDNKGGKCITMGSAE